MLEFTLAFSLFLKDYFDVAVIAALLGVNAAVGFFQEQKASGAVQALKQRLQVSARVLRNGSWRGVLARALVPGDIVRVRAGDFVPADLKVIEAAELSVDQSALTGESMAVERKEGGILYSGSIVRAGETNAVVVATGPRTYFGRTTQLLQEARPKLHMEEITSRVVRYLLAMVGVLIALVVGVSYTRGTELLQVIPLALVLVVFAVPVALPAMFTVSMAFGSLELAREGVLVTRLSASEDAASMDILCVDKTGTITENRISVAEVVPASGFDESSTLLYGALASQEANQDPIDLAFLAAARDRRLDLAAYTKERFIPFDPATRRTEAVVSSGKKRVRAMKGAVEVVARLCGRDVKSTGLEGKLTDLASKGYRALGVAMSEDGHAMRFCGIVALYDAPRPDSRDFIGHLKGLGVSVKMLTGDALPVARDISRQVGLGDLVVRATDLRKVIEVRPKSAAELAGNSDGFAEVYPEDKYVIVKSLQAGGHVTGMTGDGVNDAPALKQAEVGIAVSNATDVAKGAASAVLTEPGLSNIVSLVQVGRMIYQRIVTWILNKVVKTFEVAVFVALAFLITGYYVVSALDILLLLFLVDFVTISLSTDRVRWSRQPEKWNVSGLVGVSALLGVFTVAELFGLLYLGLNYLGLAGEPAVLQTFVFTALFYLGMFTLVIVRERGPFWRSAPSRALIGTILVDMVVVAGLVTVGLPGMAPIPPYYVGMVFGYSLALSLVINDRAKLFLMRRFGIMG